MCSGRSFFNMCLDIGYIFLVFFSLILYTHQQAFFWHIKEFNFELNMIESKQIESPISCTHQCLQSPFCISFTICHLSSMECRLHSDENSYKNDTSLSKQCMYHRMGHSKQVPAHYLYIRTDHCGQKTKLSILDTLKSKNIKPPLQLWDKYIRNKCQSLQEMLLHRSSLYDIIPKRSKAWFMSVDIKLHSTNHNWNNIVHFTINGNYGKIGYRIPSIFIKPDSTLMRIVTAIDTEASHRYEPSIHLSVGIYTNVQVFQYQSDAGEYLYTIRINQTEVYEIKNNNPKEFENVKVYVVSPWYDSEAAMVSIRNFVYFNI